MSRMETFTRGQLIPDISMPNSRRDARYELTELVRACEGRANRGGPASGPRRLQEPRRGAKVGRFEALGEARDQRCDQGAGLVPRRGAAEALRDKSERLDQSSIVDAGLACPTLGFDTPRRGAIFIGVPHAPAACATFPDLAPSGEAG
jgi:hypothetical protein